MSPLRRRRVSNTIFPPVSAETATISRNIRLAVNKAWQQIGFFLVATLTTATRHRAKFAPSTIMFGVQRVFSRRNSQRRRHRVAFSLSGEHGALFAHGTGHHWHRRYAPRNHCCCALREVMVSSFSSLLNNVISACLTPSLDKHNRSNFNDAHPAQPFQRLLGGSLLSLRRF